MMANSKATTGEAAIWELIIHPDGPMSRETASRILALSIPESEHRKIRSLAARNRAGALTPEEQALLDDYLRVGTLLSILKSRARRILKPRRRAS